MSREIQEMFFSGGNMNPTATGNLGPVYSTSGGMFKGAVLQISAHTRSTGSLFIYESGTNAVIYNDNTPSGTNAKVSWPRQQVSNGTISTAGINPGSGNVWTPFVFNRPLVVGGSNFASGDVVRLSVYLE